MKDISKLQAEFRALEAKAKPLHEKPELTEAEATELAGYLGQMEGVKGKIDLANRAEAAFSALPADRVEVMQDSADQPFASLGEELQAIAVAALPRGERIAGKPTGVMDRRLVSRMTRNVQGAATGLNEAVPSEGGFLVEKDWSSTLIQKAHQTGLLPSYCNRIGIGPGKNGLNAPYLDEASRATGSRLGGVRVYRKNEATAPTDAHPKFGKFSLDLEDMIGLCYSSNDLLEDATALGAIIERGFAQEFGFKLDDEIINGTGAGQGLGILKAASLVSVSKVPGQSADTVNAKNINQMWSQLFNGSRASPGLVWLVNQELMPQLDELALQVGTGGQLVFMPAGGISGRTYDTIKGRPVLYVEQAAAPGDAGDIILADLGEYVLIDKGGVQAAQSLHVNFTTNEMAFRFVYRVNGQPSWASALTKYKGAKTVSPFVAIEARA